VGWEGEGYSLKIPMREPAAQWDQDFGTPESKTGYPCSKGCLVSLGIILQMDESFKISAAISNCFNGNK